MFSPSFVYLNTKWSIATLLKNDKVKEIKLQIKILLLPSSPGITGMELGDNTDWLMCEIYVFITDIMLVERLFAMPWFSNFLTCFCVSFSVIVASYCCGVSLCLLLVLLLSLFPRLLMTVGCESSICTQSTPKKIV